MRVAKLLFIVCLLTGVIALRTPVLAVDSWTDRVQEGGLQEIGDQAFDESGEPERSIESIVAGVIKVMLGLLGIIFVVLLILAGFKYMTAGGDQDKIQEAVKQIRNAVIGLIIVVVAYSITYFITEQVIPQITSDQP